MFQDMIATRGLWLFCFVSAAIAMIIATLRAIEVRLRSTSHRNQKKVNPYPTKCFTFSHKDKDGASNWAVEYEGSYVSRVIVVKETGEVQLGRWDIVPPIHAESIHPHPDITLITRAEFTELWENHARNSFKEEDKVYTRHTFFESVKDPETGWVEQKPKYWYAEYVHTWATRQIIISDQGELLSISGRNFYYPDAPSGKKDQLKPSAQQISKEEFEAVWDKHVDELPIEVEITWSID